jgi:hypothetical protein
MTDPDPDTTPLQFTASFPCDGRFRPAVARLAAKVASSLGYSEGETREIGEAIERAFVDVAHGGGVGHEVQVQVTFRGGGEALSATVSYDTRTLLELSRPHLH